MGSWPKGVGFLSQDKIEERTLLAVLIELYDKPDLNKSDRNDNA
jgi:hypothetical protein